jgi:hypothetical protein
VPPECGVGQLMRRRAGGCPRRRLACCPALSRPRRWRSQERREVAARRPAVAGAATGRRRGPARPFHVRGTGPLDPGPVLRLAPARCRDRAAARSHVTTGKAAVGRTAGRVLTVRACGSRGARLRQRLVAIRQSQACTEERPAKPASPRRGQQCLLEQVLGVGERAEHPVAVQVQFTAVWVDELAEGLRAPASRALQRGVGHPDNPTCDTADKVVRERSVGLESGVSTLVI